MTIPDVQDLSDGRRHPLVGTVVEPYKILDVVAAGGMGVVFKARHMLTDRIVAMKVLPAELAKDDTNVQRLHLEAKALAQLKHENIVTTFEFGTTYMQEPFIVMEYVDGESLKEILDREVLLPIDRAVRIFVQAVDAMRYAHANGVLHRDLKPHNVMISQEPKVDHVKVLDFGVAKLSKDYQQQITRTGEVVGSPLYMSPEQCTGKPTDHRCDIYSIGVVMFETLTGNPPFRGENYISTVHMKCSKPPPSFKDVVPGRVFPERLEAIVMKCLEIEPGKRYATMVDLRNDLELVAGTLPKVDRPRTSQSLTMSTAGSQQSDSQSQKHEPPILTSSPGAGEIGWKPSWADGGISATGPTIASSTDRWSDSIAGVSDPDRPAFSDAGLAGQAPQVASTTNSPPVGLTPPGSVPTSGPPGMPVNTPQAAPIPATNAIGIAQPQDQQPPSLGQNPGTLLQNLAQGRAKQSQEAQAELQAKPAPNTPPQGRSGISSLLTQDMASLSAALEASASTTAPVPAPAKPAQPKPPAEAPREKPANGAPAQMPPPQKLPEIEVEPQAGPVFEVPKEGKNAESPYFVLTWDSKTGPAWSAAAPQKPKLPGKATASRLPSNTRPPLTDQAVPSMPPQGAVDFRQNQPPAPPTNQVITGGHPQVTPPGGHSTVMSPGNAQRPPAGSPDHHVAPLPDQSSDSVSSLPSQRTAPPPPWGTQPQNPEPPVSPVSQVSQIDQRPSLSSAWGPAAGSKPAEGVPPALSPKLDSALRKEATAHAPEAVPQKDSPVQPPPMNVPAQLLPKEPGFDLPVSNFSPPLSHSVSPPALTNSPVPEEDHTVQTSITNRPPMPKLAGIGLESSDQLPPARHPPGSPFAEEFAPAPLTPEPRPGQVMPVKLSEKSEDPPPIPTTGQVMPVKLPSNDETGFSLKDLDAIKTPSVSSRPNTVEKPAIKEARTTSGAIPLGTKRNSRFDDDDDGQGPMRSNSAIRFSNSRGGSEEKKSLMIKLFIVAAVVIVGVIAFISIKMLTQGGEANVTSAPTDVQTDTPVQSNEPSAKTTSPPQTAVKAPPSPVKQPALGGKKPPADVNQDGDAIAGDTSSGQSSSTQKLPPTISQPTAQTQTQSPAVAKAVAKKKPKKKRKARAVAKTEPEPAVPAATPGRRHAYSTSESSYYSTGE